MGKLILNGIPYGNSEGKRGIAPYKETILYDATDATFKNITLSDSLLNYDAIIFHVHDTTYTGTNNAQQSGGYIYSRQDILGCMSSTLKQIWLAGYGNTYATYTLTDETHLTANTNVTSVCNRIIGVKYGKCDAQYIQGAEFYSKDEEQIGVWIDKKPLYRKVYDFSSSPLSIPNNTWLKINNESGIQPIYGRGIITNSTAALELAIDVDPDDGIYVRSYFTYSACDYIIIEYTKNSDTPGSGGYQAYGFSPIIYSEEEREVGVWRDNKPIYAKTFDLGALTEISYNSWYQTSISSTDFDKTIRVEGWHEDGTCYGDLMADPTRNNHANLGLQTTRNGAVSRIRWVTVYYTKLSDVAGSGSYNTLGAPTVHYTTDEQVIGTYLGKPLYRRVFDVDYTFLAPSSDDWQVTPIQIPNLGNIVDCRMFRLAGGGDYVENKNILEFGRSANSYIQYTRFIAGVNNGITIKRTIAEYTKTTD